MSSFNGTCQHADGQIKMYTGTTLGKIPLSGASAAARLTPMLKTPAERKEFAKALTEMVFLFKLFGLNPGRKSRSLSLK